ncbi:Uncharacterised protein [Mycobacteroides abscessus subsp. abscessus]|nr:Uncharacterised protein [Mycobacteroides abscessus subsp. abscessus]
MPASAWPELTLPRTSVTEFSSLAGSRVTPFCCAHFSFAAPHGTWGAQTTRSVPARSGESAIRFGLPGATARARVFEAKISGVPVSRSSPARVSIVFSSAVAMTSAGAPSLIWATRSEDPAKENVTSVFGAVLSYSVAISSKTSVREAAAKTVNVVGSSARSSPEAPVEQAERVSRATMPAAVASLFITHSYPQMRSFHHILSVSEISFPISHSSPTVSIQTIVALTAAVARLPGSSSS